MDNIKVSKQYLEFRQRVLQYTNIDMNLKLENDEQVYIAVFDVPIASNIDKRLVDAVGEEMADDIILEMMLNPDNVQKQLVNISTDGNVTSKILDEYANVVK